MARVALWMCMALAVTMVVSLFGKASGSKSLEQSAGGGPAEVGANKAAAHDQAKAAADEARQEAEMEASEDMGNSARSWADAANVPAKTVADISSKESCKPHEDPVGEGNSYMSGILKEDGEQLVAAKEKITRIVPDAQEKMENPVGSGKHTTQEGGSESLERVEGGCQNAKESVRGTMKDGDGAVEVMTKDKAAPKGSADSAMPKPEDETEASKKESSKGSFERALDVAEAASAWPEHAAKDATKSAEELFQDAQKNIKDQYNNAKRYTDASKDKAGSAADPAADKARFEYESAKEHASKIAGVVGEILRDKKAEAAGGDDGEL